MDDSRLNRNYLHKRDKAEMIDLSNLELGNVFNIAISDFGLGIVLVLVQDVFHAPLLYLPGNGHNTTSAMLRLG